MTPDSRKGIKKMNQETAGGASNAGETAGGASKETKIHVVKSGDTLGKIAKHYYDDASRYMDIFNANKDKLRDPNKIQVGQELVIP